MTSPHLILGISPHATRKQAQEAWKKLVRDLHPDAHDASKREILTQKMAEVNAAWAAWRNMSTVEAKKTSKDIAVQYSLRHPACADLIDDLLKEDIKRARGHAVKNFLSWLTFRPKGRLQAITACFCSGVSVDDNRVQFIFSTPIPAGRVALILPSIKKSGNSVSVQESKPEALIMDNPSIQSGHFQPFSKSEIAKLGFGAIDIIAPSHILDTTKTTVLMPVKNPHLLYRS